MSRGVAIVRPFFGYSGGDAVAVSIISALAPHYDIELITFSDVDIGRVERFFGLDAIPSGFRIRHPWNVRLPSSLPMRWLFIHAAMRYCKRYRSDALFFSTFGDSQAGSFTDDGGLCPE